MFGGVAVGRPIRLVRFPGADFSPEVLLSQLLEIRADIKSLHVIVEWEDETMDVYWTKTKTSKTCMASVLLSKQAANSI